MGICIENVANSGIGIIDIVGDFDDSIGVVNVGGEHVGIGIVHIKRSLIRRVQGNRGISNGRGEGGEFIGVDGIVLVRKNRRQCCWQGGCSPDRTRRRQSDDPGAIR